LRNPLNTIGLALEEAAQSGLTDQERSNIAEQARSKISALDRTIKSLLVLTTSGIDRNQPVALLDIIQDAVLQIGANTKVAFTMQKPDEDLSILGAPTEITAMVSTLISNAAEASEKGQRVVIKWYKQGDMIFIDVIDEGRGLDADTEQRLFTPHVTTKPEGAGMGLYIAKRIANLHYHGDISLRNNTSSRGCSARLSMGNGSSCSPENGEHHVE
jgi:signal transduction histidine kinase